jgi:hypothetical protein
VAAYRAYAVKADVYFVMALLEKCTCGAAAVGKPTKTPLPAVQPPPSSSTSSPSPVVVAPSLAITAVGGETRIAPAHSVDPTTESPSFTEKSRNLRREREEETVEDESAPKRRRITPTPESAPSTTPLATPAPVSEAVPAPEVAEAQKEAEAVVSDDKNAELYPEHTPQSAPTPARESTPPGPNPEQEQSDDAAEAINDANESTSAHRKIGIQHIQLVYEADGQTLQCRMCL